MTMSIDSTSIVSLDANAPYPHWPPAEKTVLSIFMAEPHMIAHAPLLTPYHFHLMEHRVVFEAILSLIEQGKGQSGMIDELIRYLHQNDELHLARGQGGLAEIFTYCPYVTEDKLRWAVEVLNRDLARRLGIKAGVELIEEAFGCGEEVSRLLDAAGAPISAILDAATGGRPPKDRKRVIIERLLAFNERKEGRATSTGIPTITEIDEVLRGVKPGHVWIIGAYPSGGKSAIAGQILTDAALEGTPSLFVPLEMTIEEVWDRSIIQASRINAELFSHPADYLKKHNMTEMSVGASNAVKSAFDKLTQAPLHIVRPENCNIRTILAVIRRAVKEHGIKLAAIDYVGLIESPGAEKDRTAALTTISRSIKGLAMELGIGILLMSQLNADGDTKDAKAIEEDADEFLQIVQERDKKKLNFGQWLHILVVKDRHNSAKGRKIPLVFHPESLRFRYGIPEAIETAKGTSNAGF